MHPLLIPYALTALLVFFNAGGRSTLERNALWLAAWTALAVVLWGIVFRDIAGDTARYYATFLVIRDMSFTEMLVYPGENFLFASYNWLVGQLGPNVRWLTGSAVLVVLAALVYGLRRLFTPYQTSLLLFIYSAYPYLIAFIASGLKQGLSLAFLLVGFILLFRRRKAGWLWLLVAPFWHSGSWLIFPFLALHLAVFNARFGYGRGLKIVFAALGVAILLSISGVNAALMSPIQNIFDLSSRYDIYFMDAEAFNYRAGFRIDFTLFSLAPIFSYFYLKRAGYPLTMPVSGWWLSLYTSLSIIYQLFAFAPFADRFAVFAWFLLPLVIFVQCMETGSRRLTTLLLLGFAVVNMLLIQFYTGAWIRLG